MKTTVTLSLAVILLFTSCSKDKSSTPSGPTPREILTSRSWLFSEYKENGVVMPFIAACQADDFLTFNTNGNYIKDMGTTHCTSGESQTFTDMWMLSADNKDLTVLSEISGELIAISESSFTIRRSGANVFEYKYVRK